MSNNMGKIILVCKGNSFTSTTYTSGIGIDSLNDITIDWGDGTTESSPSDEVFSHSYSDDGYHIITITGIIIEISSNCFMDNTSIYYAYIEGIEGTTTLGDYCFSGCTNLKKIVLKSINGFGVGCFDSCTTLSDIILPNNITQVNRGFFFQCESLKQITIPNNIQTIGVYGFYDCNGLQKIIFTNPTPPIASTDAFKYIPTSCIIYVPKGSLSAYTSASNYPSSSTYTYMEKDMIGMEKAKIIAKTLSNRTRPVGSFYHSYTNDDPNEKFYGYWIPMENRFLLATGDTYANGSTGGEVNHTLTVEEMPSHNHWRYTAPWTTSERNLSKCDIICLSGEDANRVTKYSYNTGGSESHNNMPPYLTVNIWERIV